MMPAAVVGERRVVGLVQRRGMGEQPSHEHHHRRQADQFTDGEFECFQTQTRLEHVSRLCDGKADPMRLTGPLHHQRPPSS